MVEHGHLRRYKRRLECAQMCTFCYLVAPVAVRCVKTHLGHVSFLLLDKDKTTCQPAISDVPCETLNTNGHRCGPIRSFALFRNSVTDVYA